VDRYALWSLYGLALSHYGSQVGDHIIHRVEGAVERTFFSFVKPGVYDPPLRGRVFLSTGDSFRMVTMPPDT
jgi:hypothetical protein